MTSNKTTFTEENAGSATLTLRLTSAAPWDMRVVISEDSGALASGTTAATAGSDYSSREHLGEE